MDADRFDSFARALAGRVSRRRALRGSVAAAALATIARRGESQAVRAQDALDRFTVLRHYQPATPVRNLQQALSEGYAPQLAMQPGFVEYSALVSGATVVTITVFASRAQEEAAAQQLAGWVRENLASLLPAPSQTVSGSTILQIGAPNAFCQSPASGRMPPTPTALPVCTDPARPGVGCACTTGTEHPCGDTTLLCCTNDPAGSPGEPGTCTPSSVGCNPLGPPPMPPCHGVGCGCILGVGGSCDAGLVCCQSTMGPMGPGRPGLCATPDGCGSGGEAGATPAAGAERAAALGH